MPSLWTVFITGLFTGGISCVAVQGGLLATLMASNEKAQISNNKYQIIGQFLAGKLLVYSVFGALLGVLGSAITFSPKVYGAAQIAAAVYMLGVAAALLEIHPIFRYFLFQTPRPLGKLVRSQSKSGGKYTALILGLLTVIIPCGTTQAMMINAIASGSLVSGFLIMSIFTLGTIPLFVLLGVGIAGIGKLPSYLFNRAAALGVAIVGLTGLNAGLILMGSNLYPSGLVRQAYCTISFCRVDRSQTANNIDIVINKLGYDVSSKVIKTGEEITLNIKNTDGGGCQQAFSVPSLGISKIVPIGETGVVTFKAPDKPGTLAFSCSMGMYAGQFTVVN